MKPFASVLSLLVTASPCVADIIPTEADLSPRNSARHEPVRAQLSKLGVSPGDSAAIASKLTPEQLDYFASNDQANVLVGQEDLVVMFWYEWIFAAAMGVFAWAFWYYWGNEFFFK